jgi:hypothetical protein
MAREFFLLASLILVGIIFFSIFQTYVLTQTEEVKKAEARAEMEKIASLAYKISKDPSTYFQYCFSVPFSNVTIENGILRFETKNYKFSTLLPSNVENSKLIDTTKVCLVKKDSKIIISGEAEGCNFNGVCEAEECKLNCPDCYGPNNLCLNDNFCNLNIGENCKSSADCSCNSFGLNYICCPENPSSNKYGCLYLPEKKKKGQECYCDEECSTNLKCNPVDLSFTAYKKACCEEGKRWNGSECIQKEVCSYPCSLDCILPEKWDWRKVNGKNWLTPVKDQLVSGSCWAFATTGMIEAQYKIEKKKPDENPDLSEQDLISCSGAGSVKSGGNQFLATLYVKKTGVVDENCFPYVARDVPCEKCPDWSSRTIKVNDIMLPMDEETLKRILVCNGPLAVSFLVSTPSGRGGGHAVVLVGYDDEKNVWIIKNSWGVGYGDNGYGYIPYGGGDDGMGFIWSPIALPIVGVKNVVP